MDPDKQKHMFLSWWHVAPLLSRFVGHFFSWLMRPSSIPKNHPDLSGSPSNHLQCGANAMFVGL